MTTLSKGKMRGFFATTPASKLPPQRTSPLGTPVLAGDPGFPLRMTTLKVSGRMTIFEYQRQALLNGEDPAERPGLFISFHYVKYTGWSVTQMHSRGILDLVWMVRHGRLLHRMRGLTRFLEAFVAQQKTNAGILRSAQNDNFEGVGGRVEMWRGFSI